jgi:hypothetical protein
MTLQLREYVIAEGHLEDFVAAWLAGVVPLRLRLGFRIEGAWTDPSERRFVWLLGHDGDEDEFERLNAAYYASPERAAVDPDPAQWVDQSRQTFVRSILPG